MDLEKFFCHQNLEKFEFAVVQPDPKNFGSLDVILNFENWLSKAATFLGGKSANGIVLSFLTCIAQKVFNTSGSNSLRQLLLKQVDCEFKDKSDS